MKESKRLPDGMSVKTAACGIMITLGVSGMMLSSGAQLATRNGAIHMVMAGLGTFLMGIAIFSAWNVGRSSRNDSDCRTAPPTRQGDNKDKEPTS